MEDPKRLSDEGDAFERDLLDAARMDVGSAEAESNCLNMLASTRPVGPSSPLLLAGKRLLLGVGAGVVITGALVAWWPRSRPASQPAAEGASAKAVLVPHEESPPPTPTEVPAVTLAVPETQAEPATTLADDVHAENARTRAGTTSRAGGGSLSEEVALLQSARRALAAQDPAAAMIKLDRYARRFKSGLMRLEAGVLRVQALLTQGNTRAAHEHAQQFLSAHPEGPHAKRVRSLLDAGTNP
jgi:hypothetical protein